MKKIKIFSLLSFLLIALVYTSNLMSIPDKVILIDGEELKLNTIAGITVNKKENETYDAMQTVATIGEKLDVLKQVDYQVSLLDRIPIKTVEANIIPKTTVIPIGSTIGLKLYTDGVLVVGMSEIENIDKQKVKPYENTQIQEGDRIISIDDKSITCTADLLEVVNESNGNAVKIDFVREDEVLSSYMFPAKISSKEYKLGLWVRDAAAGVRNNFIL